MFTNRLQGVVMSKEIIWHFTCKDCKNWWSYATQEEWEPSRRMWCPHCGWKHSSIEMYNQGREPRFSEKKMAKGIINIEIKTHEEDYEGVPI